jgi:hypothetical protein
VGQGMHARHKRVQKPTCTILIMWLKHRKQNEANKTTTAILSLSRIDLKVEPSYMTWKKNNYFTISSSKNLDRVADHSQSNTTLQRSKNNTSISRCTHPMSNLAPILRIFIHLSFCKFPRMGDQTLISALFVLAVALPISGRPDVEEYSLW